MPRSVFRHHDEVPPRIGSPLYRALVEEWVHLNAPASSAATVRRWGQLEGCLAGLDRPADVVDAIDAAGGAAEDGMLLALVRLTHRGQQLAGRVVLQVMLPKLGRMTLRTSGTSTDNAWTEDRRHIAVAEFWDVLARYPVARRPRRVAANLALDTLHRITAETRGPGRDIPVDPHVTELLPGVHVRHVHRYRWPDLVAALDEPDGESDLLHVLTWAVERGVISRGDGRLLAQVYLPGPTGGAGGAERAARDLDVTPDAVRQRCSRARRRLIGAIRERGPESGGRGAPEAITG